MGGYEDYTDMGPTRFEETDLFARGVNISDVRPAEPAPDAPPNFKQKVVRRVEVPFSRKVKVPTKKMDVVPTMVKMKVPIKKLIKVPTFEIVEEEYTVYEEREAIREKEVWVKKIVPEKYIQKVHPSFNTPCPIFLLRTIKTSFYNVFKMRCSKFSLSWVFAVLEHANPEQAILIVFVVIRYQ